MKFLSLVALVFTAVAHTALGIPQLNSVSSVPGLIGDVQGAVPMEALNGTALEDANHLRKMCEEGGPNAYTAFKYEGGEEVVYSYNMCLLKTLNGNRSVMGVPCKSVICYGYSNPNCTGDMSEGIPYIKGTPYPAETTNAAYGLVLNRQSATCQPLVEDQII